MFDCLAIGNSTRDIFLFPKEAEVREDHQRQHPFPELCFVHGSKISVHRVEERIGGNAANLAVGVSRLGHQAAISTYLGGDDWGDFILKRLKAEGVETGYVFIDKKHRSAFSTLIVYEAERTILSYHGDRDPSSQVALLPQEPVARWLYLTSLAGDWQAVYRQAIAKAAEKNVRIAINPGVPQLEAGLSALRAIFSLTTVVFLNREETLGLLKLPPQTHRQELVQELQKLGPQIAVVTNGRKGSTASDGTELYEAPMFPGEAFEPTGAGDSFAAGFLGRLLYEDHGLVERYSISTIREALAWGAVNAASVVQSIGPQEGLLSRKQIEERLKKARTFVVRSRKI